MSDWDSDNSCIVKHTTRGFSKKAKAKMDPIRKLRIIYALDNGQLKNDIAREYGVHPQTITYIYKQKDSILKKYSHKYKLLKEVRCISLDQSLMDWLALQTRCGNVVTEANLHEKSLEILKNLNEEFPCIDDWLADFIIRHNVLKYKVGKCSTQAKEEWMGLLHSTDARELYIGSTCSLMYSLSFDSFVRGHNSDDYMSMLMLVNSTGCDKKMLCVVGKETLDKEFNIRSLPVDYYRCNLPQVDTNVISNYLEKWNTDLNCKGRNIILVMNLPDDVTKKLCFSNIKVFNILDMDFVTNATEKITDCFKYHYRKLQITRKSINSESKQLRLTDYIDMISAAWHNVSNYFIKQKFFLPEDSLYFNIDDDDFAENQCLSHWCRMFNIPINLELYTNSVDEFVYCDRHLQSINIEEKEFDYVPVGFVPEKNTTPSASGIEAYQAMKRLLSYIQGECARTTTIQSAKILENHLECGAITEIKDIVACSPTNDTE